MVGDYQVRGSINSLNHCWSWNSGIRQTSSSYSRIINKSLLTYTTSQLLFIPPANFKIFPSEIHSDSKVVVQKLCNFNKNKKINIKHSVFSLSWLITFLKCLYKVLLMSAILFLRQLFERWSNNCFWMQSEICDWLDVCSSHRHR